MTSIPVKEVVAARVPPSLRLAIDDAAASLGQRRSTFICNALKDYVASLPPDRARAALAEPLPA